MSSIAYRYPPPLLEQFPCDYCNEPTWENELNKNLYCLECAKLGACEMCYTRAEADTMIVLEHEPGYTQRCCVPCQVKLSLRFGVAWMVA